MTDKESKLIERLMHGDMEAYDELCPNAKPEDREKVRSFLKEVRQCDEVSLLWIAWFMFLTGKSVDDIVEDIRALAEKEYRATAEKENKALADAWDKCMTNIVNKQNKE